MTDKIRWGILSTANIGRKKVIPAIQQSSNGIVAAVASRHLSRAQAFAADLDIPTAYGSYEDLITDPNIDAIYNPLPNSEHATWSVRCAEEGKPVLCEKPLASNADEAQFMVNTFAEEGVLFAEAFMYRFHPQTVRVKAMLDAGAIGNLQVIQSTFTFPISHEGDIRLSDELAGGSLMDVGCYCVNIMRFLTGEEPVDARAFAVYGEHSRVDETLTGLLAFPSGVVGHFDSGLRTHLANTYELRGTTGRIAVDPAFTPGPDQPSTIHYWHDSSYEAIEVAPANQYTLMAEDFADALLNNRPPRFAPQDAVANMAALDMLYAAAEEL